MFFIIILGQAYLSTYLCGVERRELRFIVVVFNLRFLRCSKEEEEEKEKKKILGGGEFRDEFPT